MEVRGPLINLANKMEQVSSVILVLSPVVGLLTRNPKVTALMSLCMLGAVLATTLVHLLTLPLELDASFKKAMPYLEKVEYIHEKDLKAAKKILTACALTYLAQSLRSLASLSRWLRFLKR